MHDSLISTDSNQLLKKLLYRSSHRGCKETDFLVGEFVKEKISTLQNQDLQQLERFLEEDDVKIYEWILGGSQSPQTYQSLILMIRNFHQIS